MASPDRLDPPAFSGRFANLDSDIPAEMKLADWCSRPSGAPGFDSSTAAGGAAGPDLAPDDRILRARIRAHGPRGWRGPRPGEEAMSPPHASELLAEQVASKRQRSASLRRLGRDGRLAAYRRGEFDLDTCCLWASRYPRELPLLNGEFEFIARFTPEVYE
jgi:hypothetical protein